CNALRAQNAKDNAGWDKLIISNNGSNIRAVSPNNGIVLNNSLFKSYYDAYVDQVWSKYSNTTLTVNTQAAAGNVTARFSNGTLNFSTGNISYYQPSTSNIFSNSSGAFAVSGDPVKDAITARLAAAFNRSTLLINTQQPNGENVSN
ncbi:beta-1,3-glucanase family protein, partial [Zobellella maritima]|uniref:beta-1,3-glucanase family protein n=1 Tax=Zobellella maritima TaxID=2059725 RepID=UPI0018E558D3